MHCSIDRHANSQYNRHEPLANSKYNLHDSRENSENNRHDPHADGHFYKYIGPTSRNPLLSHDFSLPKIRLTGEYIRR